ncbi:hypothetical protein [Alloyangia pacifica]|uniref:hypothetical protein n=1 Tax=Alloyangia pacifica TaxID=311180 RepID=UPI0031E46052
MPRFSQPALLADPTPRAKWIEALLVEGCVILTDMPDSDAGLTEAAGGDWSGPPDFLRRPL